jgi:hypothetical protein
VRFLRRNEHYLLLPEMRDTFVLQMHGRYGSQSGLQTGFVSDVRRETRLELSNLVLVDSLPLAVII